MHVAASVALALALAALAAWLYAVATANFLAMGQFGLVTVLGWAYFAGLACAVGALVIELLTPTLRTGRVLVIIAILCVYMFGTACAIEPIAGLTDSWSHAGYVQYILEHGRILNNFDAEFSWPGGSSLGAVLVAFCGQPTALFLLRWFPLAIELLYLAPLYVIAKFSGVGRRAGLLGIALCYVTNWIYQDYFSPQALNYLFFLVVVAGVLACWRPARTSARAHARRDLAARFGDARAAISVHRIFGEDATTSWGTAEVLALLGVLVAVCLASAMSHQLTPYMIIVALLACVFARRLARPELVVVAGLFAIGWLSLGASNFWIGHLSTIFGGLGQVGGTLHSNLSNRVTGAASHRLVVDLRILLTAGILGLACIGALRRAVDSRVVELLAAAPFVLLATQGYGGEGLLRVVLFSLPFASLLAAAAILPTRSGAIRPFLAELRLGRHERTVIAAAMVAVLLCCAVVTTVVRGGNDAYEAYSTGELAAVDYTYAHVRDSQTITSVAPYLPIGQEKVGLVALSSISDGTDTPTLAYVETHIDKSTWVILSRSQQAWGVIIAGYPSNWETTLERFLTAKGYAVATSNGTATVLRRARAA